MGKSIEFLRWFLANPIVVLIILYAYWLLSVPFAMIAWGLFLFSVYLVFVILERIFRRNGFVSIILLIAVLLISIPSLFYSLIAVSLIFDYGLENATSTTALLIGVGSMLFSLFQKLTSGDNKLSKIMFVVITPLLCLNILFYTIYYPIVRDIADMDGLKYYIVRELNDDFHSYDVFYKCTSWSFKCDRLYSSLGYGDTRIIIDENMREASLYEKSTLQYTDGANSRYYQGYATLLNNHRYILSWTCPKITPSDCDNVVYVPYQCDLDFTSCVPLPIRYIDYYDNYYLALDINQSTGEINLIEDYGDDPVLIFAYGENPRCYVKGCEILEK